MFTGIETDQEAIDAKRRAEKRRGLRLTLDWLGCRRLVNRIKDFTEGELDEMDFLVRQAHLVIDLQSKQK